MKQVKKMVTLLVIFVITMMLSTQAFAAVKINKKSISLNKGKQYQLKITGSKKKVKWSSSNKKIATVTSKGKVKAIKSGKCTITAKVGSKKYKCTVTVKKSVIKVKDITLDTYELKLNKGSGRYLYETVYPSNATNSRLKWYSSNTNVATVSSNGYVTAKNPGTARITVEATDGSGVWADCYVEVVKPTIYLTSLSPYIRSGEIVSYENRTRTDIFGRVYNHYIVSNGDGGHLMTSKASMTYRIDGKYTKLTGTFFLPINRTDVQSHYVSIIGDGSVLYSNYIGGGTNSKNFSVSVKGVRDLTIVMYGNYNWATTLGEPKLYG